MEKIKAMNQKAANYSLDLLLFVVTFGLYQAIQQNKNPFSYNINNNKFNTKPDTLLNNSYKNYIVQEERFKVQ